MNLRRRVNEVRAGAGFPHDGTFGRSGLAPGAINPPRAGRSGEGPTGTRAFNQKEKTKLSALSAEIHTMKVVTKLVVLLIVGVFSAVVASATTPQAAYLESCRREPGVPVPVQVVAPTVGSEFSGGSVQLEFVVNEAGKPVAFSIKSTTDEDLAVAVVQAVKQWRFLPAEANGVAVATKVLLPVNIVDPVAEAPRFAGGK